MARYTKRVYQIGEYWLSKRGNSPAWCRTWFDDRTRQTRRVSVGTTHLEEAKKLLADWFVVNHTPESNTPSDHPLSQVIARYWEQHGQHLASAERTRISLGYWLEFFGERSIAEVADADLQRRFHTWLSEKGMKGSSVTLVLGAGRAAINYAWKSGEIASAPFVLPFANKGHEAAPPKGRPLEPDEVVALYESTSNSNLTTFIILMLATAGRPEAILNLTRDRCDVAERLIKQNDDGRPQTKKYRPTVRMPESIVAFIEKFPAESAPCYLVGHGTTPLKGVRTSWRNARARAGLGKDVNPYSLRHTIARWLRKQGVPAWEVSAQLGHKRQELSITEIYAPYDPSYLSEATQAIDSFFAELRAKSVLFDETLGGLE